MSLLNKIPEVTHCCMCVSDLRTAAAIIAVLGIVTSPALSWVVVRHAYVIRMSCFLTTSATRPDVVDINLHSVITFGFGANAGLGPCCLQKNKPKVKLSSSEEETKNNLFASCIRYLGWIVLMVDVIFLLTSIYLLVNMNKGRNASASKIFIIVALVSIILSFFYGMTYVASCIYVGGSFPVFEFFFCIMDLVLWTYFLIVVNSYRLNTS